MTKSDTGELPEFQEQLPETGIDATNTQRSTSKSQMQWQKSCQFLVTFQQFPHCPQLPKELSNGAPCAKILPHPCYL